MVLAGASHTMYFVNCCPASVTFDIAIDMHNKINGHTRYLSLGEIELPTLYLVRTSEEPVVLDHQANIARHASQELQIIPDQREFADHVLAVHDRLGDLVIHSVLEQEQCPPDPLPDDRPGSVQSAHVASAR